MEIFDAMEHQGHEQVVFCHDKVSGLKAIIAIHDTTLGPALGGCRMWPYETEEDALTDVLRLSRAMTYKNSAMGLNVGGGKAVIIGDPRTEKSEELFRAFGKFVASLGGRYITAEDVSVSADDVSIIARETEWVVGLPEKSGDPAPATAFGVFRGIQASLRHLFGDDSLAGRKVAIQGAGAVGQRLGRHLKEGGAEVFITDIFTDKVQEAVDGWGAKAVDPDDIIGLECDVFAPCALGGIINDDTLGRLKAKIVAGSANNQLAEDRHADSLREAGILYAPDYVINGGGVINVTEEFHPQGYEKERSYARIGQIYDKLLRVYTISEEQGVSTRQAADLMAEQRIEAIGRLHRLYVP